MTAPRKISVYTIDAQTKKRTKEWVFTLNEGEVKAEQLVKDPFYPVVFDKDKNLSPDDGVRFMEKLKDAYPRSSYVDIEVED